MTQLTYRSDIDGLRAIAVLSVVLYHYGIGQLSGGFVGVDIFFVISGYLITGIIQKEIERGSFTFAGFYERRVRRIFPALFAMMLVTLFVGAYVLLPSDLVRLGNGTLSTLLFASNVLFWRQSGYFDASSEYNPLLHTWSLSVEEQFYIGLPILLILLHRFVKGGLKTALVICAIASFALCLWVQALRPTATFFLSPFRAWELLLGGAVAIGVVPPIRTARTRLLLSTGALALLLFSLWWIKAGPAFPGWQAMLPVVATAALLHAGVQGSSPVQRLLSLKPLVLVGLISYSLYLWHWPLIVFTRYRNGMEPLAPIMGWLLLGVAILLAAASYRWVETPLRRSKQGASGLSRRGVFLGATAGCVLLAGTALAVRLQDGWQMRFSSEVVALDEARHPVIPFQDCEKRAPNFNSDACRIGVKGKPPRVLLWGDSHALAWAPAMDEMLRRRGESAILAIHSACPPLLGVNNPVSFGCQEFNKTVFAWLAKHRMEEIYLVASWLSYSEPDGQYSLIDDMENKGNKTVFPLALSRVITSLRPVTKSIVLIGPTPGAPDDIPFHLAMAHRLNRSVPESKSAQQFRLRARWFWSEANRYEKTHQVILVDPAPWFCNDKICRYTSAIDNRLLYRDGGHLSLSGAQFVAKHFIADVYRLDGQFAPSSDGLR